MSVLEAEPTFRRTPSLQGSVFAEVYSAAVTPDAVTYGVIDVKRRERLIANSREVFAHPQGTVQRWAAHRMVQANIAGGDSFKEELARAQENLAMAYAAGRQVVAALRPRTEDGHLWGAPYGLNLGKAGSVQVSPDDYWMSVTTPLAKYDFDPKPLVPMNADKQDPKQELARTLCEVTSNEMEYMLGLIPAGQTQRHAEDLEQVFTAAYIHVMTNQPVIPLQAQPGRA